MCDATLQKLLCAKHYQSLNFNTAIKTLLKRSQARGKQSALPLSYHQDPSAPNSVPAVSHQAEISSLTYKFLFFILQIHLKIRPEVRYSKLQRLLHPRELSPAGWRQQGRPAQLRPQPGELQGRQEPPARTGTVCCLPNASKTLSPDNAPSKRKGGWARRLFPTKAMFYSFKAYVKFASN